MILPQCSETCQHLVGIVQQHPSVCHSSACRPLALICDCMWTRCYSSTLCQTQGCAVTVCYCVKLVHNMQSWDVLCHGMLCNVELGCFAQNVRMWRWSLSANPFSEDRKVSVFVKKKTKTCGLKTFGLVWECCFFEPKHFEVYTVTVLTFINNLIKIQWQFHKYRFESSDCNQWTF